MPNQPFSIDYTSRDYASLRESMLSFAAGALPDWAGARNRDPSDFGVMVLEGVAYQGDILSYYVDRVANEAFLATATQRESVLAHASALDYIPRPATAATALLSFTVDTSASMLIPTGFQVTTTAQGDGVVTFETTAPLAISPSTGGVAVPVTVLAVEGVSVHDEVIGTSSGAQNEMFTLQQSPVVAASVVVRVVEAPASLGAVWQVVSDLLDAGPIDNRYMLLPGADDSITVEFGDGVNGRMPPRGSVAYASYRVGGGQAGNIDIGALTIVINEGNYSYANPAVTPAVPPLISVVNQQPATGGTDAESIESIRINAPLALRAQKRAVSLADYEALALTVPTAQVGKARAVAVVYTNVTVYVAPPGGGQPSSATLQTVVNYFTDKVLAGVTVVAATPTYVGVDVAMSVEIDSRYSQSDTTINVRNALAGLLNFDQVDFGFRVALSDIFAVITGVPGVTHVLVSKLARSGQTGTTDIVLRDNELPVVGQVDLIANGGTLPSSTSVVVTGTSAVAPTATAAPTLALIRCDPNSTHAELTWTAGANTTYWDVQVSFLSSTNAVIDERLFGSFTQPQAMLDIPLIGQGRAAQISFRTRAFNGSTGPAVSVVTTVPYTCG